MNNDLYAVQWNGIDMTHIALNHLEPWVLGQVVAKPHDVEGHDIVTGDKEFRN